MGKTGFDISAAILARRHRPVASMIALDPLRRPMRLVTYRRTDRASETADKYGTFSSIFFACDPAVRPGRYGANTCASCEALNPLYRAILVVSCWRISSSVETGRIGVHSFVVDESGIDLNVAY
jgi:hypothetical protein